MAHILLDLALVLVLFLRPLRAMRSLRALRLTAALLLVGRGIKSSRRALMRHGLAYVLLVAILIIVAGVIIIHDVEPGHPGSKTEGWGVRPCGRSRRSRRPAPRPRGRPVARGSSCAWCCVVSLASWFVEVEDEKHEQVRQRELEERLDSLQATLESR